MMAEVIPTYAADGAELVEAYSEFWREFIKLVNGKVTPNALTVSPKQLISGRSLRLDFGRDAGPMALLGVTSKGAPGTNAFDVYISGMQVVERIREDDEVRWVVLRSEFDLLYLNALETATVRRAWRERATSGQQLSVAYAGYQFVSNLMEPLAKHFPDCHARYNLEAIGEETIERAYKEADSGWSARARHGQPQIPTAPFDLTGLLYMVLHCHLSVAVEKGWPKNMGKVVARLPAFKLDVNSRSEYSSWYEHSHAAPPDVVPVVPSNAPADFTVPPSLKAAGWNARIRGRERSETPHLTINLSDSKDWRLSLRTGDLLEGSKGEIADALLRELERTKDAWCALWDQMYPENVVGNRTW